MSIKNIYVNLIDKFDQIGEFLEKNMNQVTLPLFDNLIPPLMTREKWAAVVGLPETVVTAQAERGLWGAPVHIGKRVFINVEAVRIAAAKKAEQFTL